MNGVNDLVWIFLSRKEAVPSPSQNPGRAERVLMRGNDQQLDCGNRESQRFDKFAPAFSKESIMRQHKLRLGAGDGRESLVQRVGRAADHQVSGIVEQGRQPFVKGEGILQNEYLPGRPGQLAVE
jgi:hypothetical protein